MRAHGMALDLGDDFERNVLEFKGHPAIAGSNQTANVLPFKPR